MFFVSIGQITAMVHSSLRIPILPLMVRKEIYQQEAISHIPVAAARLHLVIPTRRTKETSLPIVQA